MATYTSNYAWTKPSGNDQVDISVLNDNLDSQDAIMHKAFTNMAQAFSELSTYAVGDIVLYDNELYKCHTAVVTPGSWTGSTNWQVHKLSEGGSGTSNYNQLTNKPQINSVELSGNKTAAQLGMANSNTFQGTIAEWNQLTTAEKKAYDHASIPDSIDGGVTFPANKVIMTGGGNVENAIPKFERKTISGTTDSNGWLTTGLSPQSYVYVSTLNSGSVIVLVLNAQSDNTIRFKITYGDGNPVSNTSMALTCLFMKIS